MDKRNCITDEHYSEIVEAFGQEVADKFIQGDYPTFMDFLAKEVI